MSRLTGGILVAAAALVAVGCFLMSKPSSKSAEPADSKPQPTEFAADRLSPAPFDARRAMGYLDDLCAIGPRISGTEGMKKQQELLKKHFEALGGKVELQPFTARQVSQKQPVEMANLLVSWNPERDRRVILCSHYDTRPVADQEPNPRRWHDPFVSANDGGSGVALLMELGHAMKDLKTNVGVDFVFFDGEEYVFEKTDRYFFGSDHFAGLYRKGKPQFKYVAAILLDMIGGKDPRFPVETNSWFQANLLVQQVWQTAQEQKCPAFVLAEGPTVEDDHVALNRGGIPAIDIIDFSYKHWHRLTDTPENCSGDSLEQVARVLSVWLQRVK
jgi:peptidase M28-like protein